MSDERTKAFVSYRRTDGGYAHLLADKIRKSFGDDSIFLDVTNVFPGEEWEDRLQEELRQSKVLVALICDDWLAEREAPTGDRPPERARDWVVFEVTAALDDENCSVIPVLLPNVSWPETTGIASDNFLKRLGRWQGIELHDDDLEAGMERVLEAIRYAEPEWVPIAPLPPILPPPAPPPITAMVFLTLSLITAVIGFVAARNITMDEPLLTPTTFLVEQDDRALDFIAERVQNSPGQHSAVFAMSDCGAKPVEIVPLGLNSAFDMTSIALGGAPSKLNLGNNLRFAANDLAARIRPDRLVANHEPVATVTIVASRPDECGTDFEALNRHLRSLENVRVRVNAIGIVDETELPTLESQLCSVEFSLLLHAQSSHDARQLLQQLAGQGILDEVEVLTEIVNLVGDLISSAAEYIELDTSESLKDAQTALADAKDEWSRTQSLFEASADFDDHHTYQQIYELDGRQRELQQQVFVTLASLLEAIEQQSAERIVEDAAEYSENEKLIETLNGQVSTLTEQLRGDFAKLEAANQCGAG